MRRAVIITDRDQRILWVNPAFERITGFRRTDAVGAVCDDLLRYKELNPAVVSSWPPIRSSGSRSTMRSGSSTPGARR